jgi:hypothetical protein
MPRIVRLCIASAAMLLFGTGCASSGVFPSAHITNVELSSGNYSVVATNVAGEASAAYLFGVSAAIGTEMRTVARFRIQGEPLLYQQAIRNLWQNFEAVHGTAAGRSLALVNVRFDAEALNVVIYTRPLISVRADVIEFTR